MIGMSIIENTDGSINTQAIYLLTDSRQLSFPQQSIFFAIKGERHDGHQFLTELYQKGVREFVIEAFSFTDLLKEHRFIFSSVSSSCSPALALLTESQKRSQAGDLMY